MASHSSILAWKNPMNRGTWQATVHGVAESDMTEQLSTEQHSYIISRDSCIHTHTHTHMHTWTTLKIKGNEDDNEFI